MPKEKVLTKFRQTGSRNLIIIKTIHATGFHHENVFANSVVKKSENTSTGKATSLVKLIPYGTHGYLPKNPMKQKIKHLI